MTAATTPAVLAQFDRTPPATYNPGDTITLTVTTADGARDVYVDTPTTVHVDVPGVGSGDATFLLHNKTGAPAPITVSDPSGRVFAAGADNGSVAAFTATA